jgi:hypothetical protein
MLESIKGGIQIKVMLIILKEFPAGWANRAVKPFFSAESKVG